jgi:hypothetical protein
LKNNLELIEQVEVGSAEFFQATRNPFVVGIGARE